MGRLSRQPLFERHGLYTRLQIHERLGGGLGECLPNLGGRVVCGCFTRRFNPDAPAVVLAGSGPNSVRSAHIFCDQEHPVPIFIKVRPNAWEYVGDYLVERATSDPEAIAKAEDQAGWRGVSMVIYLKEAGSRHSSSASRRSRQDKAE